MQKTFVLIWFCCGRPNERILFSFEFLAEIDKFRALVGVKNAHLNLRALAPRAGSPEHINVPRAGSPGDINVPRAASPGR